MPNDDDSPSSPGPLPDAAPSQEVRRSSPFGGLVTFMRKNTIAIISAGTLSAAGLVATHFYHQLKDDFEDYVRSVAFPGIDSVSEEQKKNDRFSKAVLKTNRYVRHIILPSMTDTNGTFSDLEETKGVAAADKTYSEEASKHIRRVLFNSDKGTIEDTFVEWLQTKLRPNPRGAELGSIARVLADNHTIVTDSIVGGVYSGSLLLNKDRPKYRFPVFVPSGHKVRLGYISEPGETTVIRIPLIYSVIRPGSNAIANETPLSDDMSKTIDITSAFDAVRQPDSDLLSNMFYVEIGLNREKLKIALDKLTSQLSKQKTPIPDQEATIIYAVIVERAIANKVTSK